MNKKQETAIKKIKEVIDVDYVEECGYMVKYNDDRIFVVYDYATPEEFEVLSVSFRLTPDEISGMMIDFFTRNCHAYENMLLRDKLKEFIDEN